MLQPTIYIPSRLTKLLAILWWPPQVVCPSAARAASPIRRWNRG